jgi:type II secretory pathway component PulF
MEIDQLYKKIEEQEQKINAIYKSVERTRKFFMWTLILSIAFFIVPLIGLIFVIPQFLNIYSGYGNLLK